MLVTDICLSVSCQKMFLQLISANRQNTLFNPILAPGEMITKEIIDYIIYAKEKGCSMQGTQDPAVEYLYVMEAPTGAVRR